MLSIILIILHFTSFVTSYTNNYISVKLFCAFLHLHYTPPGLPIEHSLQKHFLAMDFERVNRHIKPSQGDDVIDDASMRLAELNC